MKIDLLIPEPIRSVPFRKSKEYILPDKSACYVMTNFHREVMYVGLANNLRRRFSQHLDDENKTTVTKIGRVILFWWFETDDLNKIERTWMNIHIQHEGALPLLNSVYSPTAT